MSGYTALKHRESKVRFDAKFQSEMDYTCQTRQVLLFAMTWYIKRMILNTIKNVLCISKGGMGHFHYVMYFLSKYTMI